MKKVYESPVMDIVRYDTPENVLLTVSSTNNLSNATGKTLSELLHS